MRKLSAPAPDFANLGATPHVAESAMVVGVLAPNGRVGVGLDSADR